VSPGKGGSPVSKGGKSGKRSRAKSPRSQPARAQKGKKPGTKALFAVCAALFIGTAIAATWYFCSRPTPDAPNGPALAVDGPDEEAASELLDAARRLSTPTEQEPAAAEAPPAEASPAENPVSPRETAVKPRLRPRSAPTLVIVIDDAGHNLEQLEPFLGLPFPLTVAVLPGLPMSSAAARAVTASGKELILHQPMEAVGGEDPGPGALRRGMGWAEIESLLESNLADVPGARGMNNHMGSSATADPALMAGVAAVVKGRGIYYLDSLTAPATATARAAAREGIRYWERDVFLDNTPDRASILRAVEDGKRRALKGGPAIMIGHVWSAELAQTLLDLYPQLADEGFSLSTISRLMLDEAGEDDASPRH
jgi:polysaccharide deacetylase 2 family uncharacterized protein YibQ